MVGFEPRHVRRFRGCPSKSFVNNFGLRHPAASCLWSAYREVKTMFKSTLMCVASACVLTVLAATSGASAATCTQADMTKMDADVAAMSDATKRDAAMKEMTMAREMRAKSDNAGCMMHMDGAMKMMPAK